MIAVELDDDVDGGIYRFVSVEVDDSHSPKVGNVWWGFFSKLRGQ